MDLHTQSLQVLRMHLLHASRIMYASQQLMLSHLKLQRISPSHYSSLREEITNFNVKRRSLPSLWMGYSTRMMPTVWVQKSFEMPLYGEQDVYMYLNETVVLSLSELSSLKSK